jgi:hypothetical protein
MMTSENIKPPGRRAAGEALFDVGFYRIIAADVFFAADVFLRVHPQ